MKMPGSPIDPRPLLFGLAGLGLAFAVAAGPVSDAIDASRRIAEARERLVRAQEVATRPAQAVPLVAPDADALLAQFRRRLETLAENRAAVLDSAVIEPDPNGPDLPRLHASLRGTAEGLHDLIHDLETGSPRVAIEEADLALERQADPETGRPGVMRANLTARGILLPPTPADPAVRR